MPRVYVAGLFHETHTFLEEGTGLEHFQIRRGQEMLLCAGDSSPLGGCLQCFQSWGWDLVPGADYRAVPSGTVDDAVVESFWRDCRSAWQEDVDAIFLVLHGAMVSQTLRDVEGELLTRFRRLPGAANLPLFGVYDLHANFSAAMATAANGLLAYRQNPHTDARQAAVRAAELLRRCLKTGQRPTMVHRGTGHVWAPTRTGTADDPMRSLEQMARDLERQHSSVWGVNVSAGFAFADTPDTAASFQIATTDPEAVEPLLDQLQAKALKLDAAAAADDEPLEQVMRRLADPVPGLTVLVEPSDNIGGGAPGDATGLLRALVDHRIGKAAICINDAAAVEQVCSRTAQQLRLAIGGKGSRFDPGPVELLVDVVSTGDGRFQLEDKQSHLASMSGDTFDMGPCAVVRHAGLLILLTSHKTPPFDLGQWRSQGIEPTELNVIVVKAAVAHRKAYDPITARSFWVDTPGPCRSDLSQFNYRYARMR